MSTAADRSAAPQMVVIDGQPIVRPLSLRVYPDPVLRQSCGPVEEFDSTLADVLEEMLSLMRLHHGIGLAGPQAGIPRQLFVARIGNEVIRLANPHITAVSGRVTMREGCLSLPGFEAMVERSRAIQVIGYDPCGRKQGLGVEGMWARVMQHEINHLSGVLICDRIKETQWVANGGSDLSVVEGRPYLNVHPAVQAASQT